MATATVSQSPNRIDDVTGTATMSAVLHLDMAQLPCSLVWSTAVSDKALEQLCAANDVLRLERTKEGAIRVNPPTGMFTSDGNSEVTHQLRSWWSSHERGRALDSNAGFYLPDGSMLNPDGAYVSEERLAAHPAHLNNGFPHLCPDFVIEILSKSDSLKATKKKMELWIANGALLGWLINPYKRNVLVYAPDAPPTTITGTFLEGTGPVAGFTLDLARVWRRFE